eukprot:12678-Heterococcus_DN1.PRE.2
MTRASPFELNPLSSLTYCSLLRMRVFLSCVLGLIIGVKAQCYIVSMQQPLPESPLSEAFLPKSPSAQIFLDGVLQAATLDPACASPKAICGGTLTVNGEKVIVPKNAMVMLPANALTWQELFKGTTSTGLAIADPVRKPGGYSVSVAANRVKDQIIAATIDISQANIISAGGESAYDTA